MVPHWMPLEIEDNAACRLYHVPTDLGLSQSGRLGRVHPSGRPEERRQSQTLQV